MAIDITRRAAVWIAYATAVMTVVTFGVALAVVTTTILISTYFVQFTVVPASLAHDQTDGIALLTQYNPHGLFIALEEVGYLTMALSFGAIAVTVVGRRPAARAVRWLFGATPVAVLAALVWVTVTRGTDRGYLFEVIVISIDWLALLVGSVLLARLFRAPADSGSSPAG